MNTLTTILLAWTALSCVCFTIVKAFNLEQKVAELEKGLEGDA